MRYDPKNPHYHNNDRFILSKGHVAPLLYALWAEAGLFPVEDLAKLRRIGFRMASRLLVTRPTWSCQPSGRSPAASIKSRSAL